MDHFLHSALAYLLNVSETTGIQLFIVFGPLLFLAFLMNIISVQLSKTGISLLGQKGFVYGFKWLGTPFHEAGHALFALLSGHRITDIKLFDPRAGDGSFGYVRHSYAKGGIYRETGNFFIGIGPIIMCTLVLYLSALLLFGFSLTTFNKTTLTSASLIHPALLKTTAISYFHNVQNFITFLFSSSIPWWKMLIFIYLLFSVGSSITLSASDIKTSARGFIYFVLILFVVNLSTLWLTDFMSVSITKASVFLSDFYFIMLISMGLNLVFLVAFGVLVMIKKLVTG